MNLAILLAEQVGEFGSSAVTGGILASVVGWFMYQNNKRMDEMRAAIQVQAAAMDRATRAQVLLAINHTPMSPELRLHADEILRQTKSEA